MNFYLIGLLVATLYTLELVCAKRQSIDQLIIAATETSEVDYLTDLDNGLVMQELDMVLKMEQWRAMQGLSADGKRRKKRKAIKDDRYRWTSKTIPYKINTAVFSSSDMNEINAAISDWSKYTCINFREATSSDRNYIYLDNGSGCYSYVGMTGGAQTVGLAQGCRYKGVVAHEVGHAVGFHHEQNRPDRDSYVRIIKENIPESLYYNFQKYDTSYIDTMQVPYDYTSVMHYGGYAFSNNGQLTIQTLDSEAQDEIGNRDGLSFFDIKLANLMYDCHENCGSITCPGHGFVAKDCKCYCPTGDASVIAECDSTTGGGTATTARPVVTQPTAAPCDNQNEHCQSWADAGYCETSQYMQLYCKPACKLCEYVPCIDDREDCPHWESYGYCKGEYEDFMTNYCKKSCGVCSASSSEEVGGDNNSAGTLSTGLWACISAFTMLVSASIYRDW